MYEKTEEFELQNFTSHNCSNGEVRNGNKTVPWSTMYKWQSMFSLQIYPKGNKPENEDYVSIVLDKSDRGQWDIDSPWRFGMFSSLEFILSIVDSKQNLRFSQSFGIESEREVGEWLASRDRKFPDFLPVNIDRFIERRVLLDAREELLPEDTLTLRCDYFAIYSSFVSNEFQPHELYQTYLNDVSRQEFWFVKSVNDAKRLDLRDANSPLCSRLRKQSDFFEGLFRSACKEMKDGYLPVDEHEFYAFRSMLGYIRFGSLQHVLGDFEYFGIYKMACMYGVSSLEEICIDYFRENLTSENAIEILRIADSRGDADLRTLAFEKALGEWKDVVQSTQWTGLCSEWPQLAKELSCSAHILSFETDDALCHLAAGQVLLNKEKLQHSPTWTIFAKKMPDLAKMILRFDLDKYKSVEKYKNHAMKYDFYR